MSFALVWGVTYNDCKKYIPDGPVTSQTAKPFTFYHQLAPILDIILGAVQKVLGFPQFKVL